MEEFFDRSYYRGNRRMLRLIGQWPFQSGRTKKIRRCISLIFVGSIVLPKLIKLIESVHDIDVFLECIPMLGVHAISLIKFTNGIINGDRMRKLLLTLERDWKKLKLERDIKLLDEYSERGRKINILYATALLGVLGIYLVSPGIPKILDYLHPLDEPRSRIFLYQTEYFVNQDEYYVHLLIHAWIAVPVSMISVVFFDNLFAIFVNHTCGMVEILKIHLETLMTDDPNNSETALERVKVSLQLQTDIIQFVKILESSYTIALLLIVGVNMTIIALTGFVVITSLNHASQLIRFMAFNFGTIFHLFWSSWLGHKIIIHSESIFTSAYQNEWYRAPSKVKLMLLPIMMRSLEPCKITAGTVYVMSMQSFGAAMRTTVSFFTLLLSAE